jgi:hypothetical protein
MEYMFYDSARIIDKQQKYEKIRAYEMIESLEKTGLTSEYVLCALELMSRKSSSEFESSVISKAKAILVARKEKNEARTNNNVTNVPDIMPT